jgi:tetratricopeptide (TPR) repeat protein
MNPTIERGLLLFQQGRHELAIQEFQQALAADPQLGFAHACIALCLAKQEKFAEASEAAARGIEFAPDSDFTHYVAASVFHDRHDLAQAERAITEAIRLDPYDASYHGLAAAIRFEQSDWTGALERATKGLEIDPDEAGCTNIRAMAKVRLGQVVDARAELESSLSREPENAWTHANLGWAALERGEREKALECFRESLRIDPSLEFARSGMIHAIKLRYPLYGLFLKYMLWMQKLSGNGQWAVLVGGFIGYRIVRQIARQSPALAPWLTPIIVIYLVFAYMTWVGRPLTNLLLRLNRFGRAVLTADEQRESNYVGGVLGIGMVAGIAFLLTQHPAAFFTLLLCAGLVIPLSTIYSCHRGWPRKVSAAYAIMMGFIAIAIVAIVAGLQLLGDSPSLVNALRPLTTTFLIGTIAAPWISNALVTVRPKR